MGEITPAPAAPTGALRESRCTPETRAGCVPPGCPGPSLWLRLKLCPARRLVTTRVPGPGRTLRQRGLPLPSPPTQPQYPRHRTSERYRNTHLGALIKLRKDKNTPKGLDQDLVLPRRGLVRSQYLLPRRHGGGCPPPNPTKQGCSPRLVLLLVMPSGKRGWGRP